MNDGARSIALVGAGCLLVYAAYRMREHLPQDVAAAMEGAAQAATDLGEQVMAAVERVVEAGKGFTTLQLSDGTTERREGARNWRNNNPGNLEYGPFAIANGAVGSDGRFAVFATYEAGRAAKEKLIFESGSYRALTLSQAIARYAPPNENDTGWYTRTVLAAVGGSDRQMMSYTAGERASILDAMERVEGFKVGNIALL